MALVVTDRTILKKAQKKAQKVLKLDQAMQALSDDELRQKTDEFLKRHAEGETLDSLAVEAFALVREAAFRVLGQKPYLVQVMGAFIMQDGDIAEMHTGSGKTLTVTMPVYLSALDKKGVHVITVNEYLAGRDAAWMGEIYRFLGLSVGVNRRDLTPAQKREAFLCDITYTTNAELGFDYLRDNMVRSLSERVLRGLHSVFIDEIDSVLIDDARTPLIISGTPRPGNHLYDTADRFVKRLAAPVYKKDADGDDELVSGDYEIDIKTKQIYLTDSGIAKAERRFRIDNLYDLDHTLLVHHLNQALKANYIMRKEVEYIVKDGEILLVDGSTGRVMPGRQYSDGLHQAIEAKEGVKIHDELNTMATITYQNFFRLYDRLSGMTGTAKTEEEEFLTTYNMRVIPVPDHRPIIRRDLEDEVYVYKRDKYRAIVREVRRLYEKGQPVLIGTPDVDTSQIIDQLLTIQKIPHETLNAKNDAKEAEIIAKAGRKGAVTLATNMAGRGTDIKLDNEARRLGGLAVLGVERHEARRIDRQLQGRSGRQGDPGFSRFYVSLEDSLIQRFGEDRLKKLFEDSEDCHEPLHSKFLSAAIVTAQKKIENLNFDSRKQVLDYDDVLRRQREIIYKRRDAILENENRDAFIQEMMKTLAEDIIDKSENQDSLKSALRVWLLENDDLMADPLFYDDKDRSHMVQRLADAFFARYKANTKQMGAVMKNIEKEVMLQTLDRKWVDHIDTMVRLRSGIHLRAYAQNNPLQAYVEEGFALFDQMNRSVSCDAARFLLSLKTVE